MSDNLVTHALKNAWCAPRQDLQVIFKPARISRPVGLRISITHGFSTIPLPTTSDLYHVYQIGQIEPGMLGLTPGRREWRRVSRVMETEFLIANVYTNQGRMLNRSECWLIYTEERNLLLAIKDQPKVADLRTQPIYLRLYSNAFFSSPRSHSFERMIRCRSKVVTVTADGPAFQTELTTLRDRPGGVNFYYNGQYRDSVPPTNRLRPGDHLEYVYDSSIKQTIDIPLKDCPVFTSTLDQQRKYLLRSAAAQVGGIQIDFQDDIDVHLMFPLVRSNRPGFDGVYFHKNAEGALRQVTHRDWSIPTPFVEAYVQDNPDWVLSDNLVVRLQVRHSGYNRPLVFENSRIQELYKLPHQKITEAMIGTESTVEVWQAANLEASAYTQLMRSPYEEVTRAMVEDAYGYNAVSTLMGDSPRHVETVMGRRQISLPFGQWVRSTMYEFDVNGKLLGTFYHSNGPEYTPRHPDTHMVEGVVGRGQFRISTTFGPAAVEIKPQHNYRFYLTRFVAGRPDPSRWEDVTGDDTKYRIVNGRVAWLVDTALFYPAVRSDEDFLAYEFELETRNSLLRFSIDAEATHPDGAAQGTFHIPVGKLDLWLNGHSLIENLDYFVRWPEIVICNKKFVREGTTQKITVRGTGFCNADMTRPQPAEFGFVQHGMLSRNRRYNVRDDKVIRLVIDGSTHHRSVLKFAEDSSAIQAGSIREGAPYQIENIIVPMPDLIHRDDYEYLDQAVSIDKQVENYLTLKLPEPVFPEPVMIPTKYHLYSPFISVLLHDMIDGRFSMDAFRGQFSDRALKESLTNYEYLLAYDPSFHALDERYVNVHPHNQTHELVVNIYQQRFLKRAIGIYLNNQVDLARFVRVVPY